MDIDNVKAVIEAVKKRIKSHYRVTPHVGGIVDDLCSTLVDQLEDQQGHLKMSDIPIHIEITQEQYKRLRELIEEGLKFDGVLHKRWCLREIAQVLGIDVEDLGHDEGIAP
jgi:hypothetical protein